MKRASSRRWGRVSAKPCEYLIKLRRGKVVAHGPGLSVRLWPSHTCTILPTSIQRTSFVADQITAERVGVAVTGIAVYRIADPMLAFRMLDFTEGAEGMAQLSTILREMFIGAARRLVANMTVEQCLTRRKESIAHELMCEIQPVVAGSGRPQDGTDRGWGVVIDTIEIQDVKILSEKVFSDLQAPYRSRLELESRTCEVDRDQQIHQREVAARRQTLEADQDLSRREADGEAQRQLQALAGQEQIQQARVEMDRRVEKIRAELARQRAEQEAALQQASLAYQLEAAQLDEQLARRQTETEQLRAELELRLQRARRELDNLYSDERLRHELITTALPAMAQAFAHSMGQIHLTHFAGQGDGGGLAQTVAQLVPQLVQVARSVGLLGHPPVPTD